MDIKANVLDSFLLGLNVLSDLKALLEVNNDKIIFSSLGWEVSLVREIGYLYL